MFYKLFALFNDKGFEHTNFQENRLNHEIKVFIVFSTMIEYLEQSPSFFFVIGKSDDFAEWSEIKVVIKKLL